MGGLDHDGFAPQRVHCACGGRAGDAGADDRHPPDGGVLAYARHSGVGQAGLQTFALAAVAGALFDLEAGVGQRAADAAGHGEGRRPRAGRGPLSDLRQHGWRPHLRVQGRRKTIEEPGVGLAGPLGERYAHITDEKIEDRTDLREFDPVQAGRLAGPAGDQRLGERRELGPMGQGPGGVGGEERMGLHREDVQAGIGRPGLAPEIQQRRNVESGSKPQLTDHEASAAGPGLRQTAALQEHQSALGQPVLSRKIDVPEGSGSQPGRGPVEQLRHGFPVAESKGPPRGTALP